MKHLHNEKPRLVERVFTQFWMTLSATIVSILAAAMTVGTARAELTGKERLGAKWRDEQRIDNCKVPPEKRGTKTRPDSCAHGRQE